MRIVFLRSSTPPTERNTGPDAKAKALAQFSVAIVGRFGETAGVNAVADDCRGNVEALS